VRVGVSYTADPDRVRALLQECAKSCEFLRILPSSVASLDNFGAHALEFSISATAAENVDPEVAASDLRVKILKAFRAEGIELPFPQHDVHLRDLDGVRGMLTRMAEQRAQKEMGGVPPDAKPDQSSR
jgi:small-conductance mechanosensitive channel